MEQEKQKTVNPDDVVNNAMQAKLEMMDAKENFGAVLKKYDDHIKDLILVISMLKNRVLELEKPKKDKPDE